MTEAFDDFVRATNADLNTPEPPPVPNDSPAIWDLVVADMQERDRDGLRKYGTRLQAGNGRDPLVDAYQEALDLAVYLRQAIEERASRRPSPVPVTVERRTDELQPMDILVDDFGVQVVATVAPDADGTWSVLDRFGAGALGVDAGQVWRVVEAP